MKRNLTLSGGGLAALMFIPIIIDASKGASFNPLSFFLWSGLSLVLTMVLMRSGESWILPASWVVSDIIVGIALLTYFRQSATIGLHEITVMILIVICTILWITSKTWVATIACTSALTLAAVPQAIDIYQHPEHASWRIWAIYFISNTLAFFGGKTWSIEDRLPAGVSMVLCLVFVWFSLR